MRHTGSQRRREVVRRAMACVVQPLEGRALFSGATYPVESLVEAAAGATVVQQTVNWDVEVSGDTLYSGSDGVLSGSGTYWNSSYSGWLNALDESGTPTSIDLVLRQSMGVATYSGSHTMFGDGLAAGRSSALIYDISDLDPYQTYDVALYFQSSNKADVYMIDDGRSTHSLTTLYNGRVLPGSEGGEYLRFRDLKPYELSSGTYGVKFLVYSQSSIIYEVLAGVQIRNTGTRANIAPRIPVPGSPVNNATGVGLTPMLQASAFSDPDSGDTHANSQWQVDNNSSFASPEWNSGDTYAASTSVTVPSGILASSTKYYWRVRYKDSAGNWSPYSSAFAFTTASGNQAPTNIGLSATTVAENQIAGTAVGSFTATDPDAGNTFTYALVSGTGSDDNGSFTITGGQLRTAASFDYEAKNSYSIRVRATDQGGLWHEKAFTITISDVDDRAPLTITGTAGSDQISVAVDAGTYAVSRNGVMSYHWIGHVASVNIAALGGDDTISIGSGVMGVTVDGGTGNDAVTGGDGADSLRGDDGADTISGGAGDDTLMGNTGDDSLAGGEGADQIQAGLGYDLLTGGIGDDSLYAGDQMDTVYGDEGNDYIEGRGKADTIHGGVGNDTILGGAGSDLIYAEDGDDRVDVGVATVFHDSVIGGAGSDLVRSDGDDVLSGCEGSWV